MTKNLLLLTCVVFIFSGCGSIFMPYKDEFTCNKGIGMGTCSSMSENYKTITETKPKKPDTKEQSEEMTSKEKQTTQDSSCKKCEDTSHAVWLKQRALEKKIDEMEGAKQW